MMNDLLGDMDGVVVYMDDICIHAKTLKENRRITTEVLKQLEENNLFLKPQKCSFEKSEIKFLGLIISAEGIRTDPKKIEGVLKWPTPKKLKEVQSFLGFTNFYRRFVKDFVKIASPLHALAKKDAPWSWTNVHQKAFTDLKTCFTMELILHYPNPA